MIDNRFRALLAPHVEPLLRLYLRLGLTPNGVSLIGLLIAVVASVAVAKGWALLAVLLWWSSRLADGTDGIYARQTGRATEFGAYFDIVLDMAAYGSMVFGFAVLYPDLAARWLVIQFLYVLCIASALALGMQEQKRDFPARDNRGLRLGAGLAEGGETGIAYTLLLLFPNGVPLLSAVWIGILATTVLARTALARRMLTPAPPND